MIQFDEHIFGMGWNHQLEVIDGIDGTPHFLQIGFRNYSDGTGVLNGTLIFLKGTKWMTDARQPCLSEPFAKVM